MDSGSYGNNNQGGEIILDFWNRQLIPLYVKNKDEDFFRFGEINSTTNNEIINIDSYLLDTTFNYGHILLPDESVWRTRIEGNLENTDKEIPLLPTREGIPFRVGVGKGFDLWIPQNFSFENYDVFIDDVGGTNSFNNTSYYGIIDEIPLVIPSIDFIFLDNQINVDGFNIRFFNDAKFSEYTVGVNWKKDDRTGR